MRASCERVNRMSELHLDLLPDDTRRLFEFLSKLPEITRHFVLIGGTAITLHHGHRRSEDLDFRATGAKLPRQIIKSLVDKIAKEFDRPLLAMSDEMIEDFDEQGGVELLDHHQTYSVGKVKLDFFTEGREEDHAFIRDHIGAKFGSINILSSKALFELKARVIAKRTRTRDLFDLWYYLSTGLHSMDELVSATEHELHTDWEGVRRRLLPRAPETTDPGFDGLVENGPKNFGELIAGLSDFADSYESTTRLDQVLRKLDADNA